MNDQLRRNIQKLNSMLRTPPAQTVSAPLTQTPQTASAPSMQVAQGTPLIKVQDKTGAMTLAWISLVVLPFLLTYLDNYEGQLLEIAIVPVYISVVMKFFPIMFYTNPTLIIVSLSLAYMIFKFMVQNFILKNKKEFTNKHKMIYLITISLSLLLVFNTFKSTLLDRNIRKIS